MPPEPSAIPLSEVIGALSYALDLTEGEPPGHAVRSSINAQTVEIFHSASGVQAAYDVAARRAGRWFDPTMVAALAGFRYDAGFWASLAEPDLARWEPPDQVLTADAARVDRLAIAFAAIVDAKSPLDLMRLDVPQRFDPEAFGALEIVLDRPVAYE